MKQVVGQFSPQRSMEGTLISYSMRGSTLMSRKSPANPLGCCPLWTSLASWIVGHTRAKACQQGCWISPMHILIRKGDIRFDVPCCTLYSCMQFDNSKCNYGGCSRGKPRLLYFYRKYVFVFEIYEWNTNSSSYEAS